MKIKITNARLSFNSIFKAESKFEGTDPKFSAMFILDPRTDEGKENLVGIKSTIRDLEKEKLKGKELDISKLPLQDGSEKEYSGWDGNIIVSAASKTRPVVVGRKRQPVAEQDAEDVPYSGCYVNAVVDAWAMDHPQFGQRIVFELKAIQFAKAGEPFVASGVDIENDFSDIEADVEEVSSSVFDL